ncbi:DUF1986 domain-containing protein [Fluviicola sp.]|jgi:hypothetical protein|uniref:DUF1986 domain-containing protein n=1 Tax=Fluviicola sp. TaxID=1917219 RepID=UPI002819C006|nr:DUF1986 domain-containing protein [Fluviicola sp.]MDR0802874.1 serine protease [Fluviicola sp.]
MKYKYLVVFSALFLFNKSVLSQTKNVPAGSQGYSWGYSTSNILGGQQIPISAAPYQVSMKINGNHACGGSIISDRWILTAAHCVVLGGATTSNTVIHAGSDNQTSSAGQSVSVDAIYVHPSYNSSNSENDVALLHLSQSLQFNNNVMPVEYANNCNTDASDYSVGNNVYLSGWGITCNSCGVSTYLQGLSIPFISNATAMAINLAYNLTYTQNISSNMISFYNPGTGAGPGDSGGPAVIDKNGNKINLGASSWGYWPKDQLPTVYTNIRNYATWIQSVTGFSISKSGLDLYSKDKPWDMGKEPSNVSNLWESEDIWVRRQNDGIANQVHQNPEYYAIASNQDYVYVRIRNRGCVASTGTEKVTLYWAKAATALGWPNNWNGSISTSTGHPLGGVIGTITLPVIQPGNATIVTFPWSPPNPSDYIGGITTDPSLFWAEEPHHFCLLSRIEAIGDPMTVPEITDLGTNVNNNNNIVWKNLSVVDLDPANIADNGIIHTGATVLVGDGWDHGGVYDIEFASPAYFTGNPITQEAEVKITLDEALWAKWQQTGFHSDNIEIVNPQQHQVVMAGPNARLYNLVFQPHERNLAHVGFNFLTQQSSNQNEFDFCVIQRMSSDNSVLGGETYKIYKKQERDLFIADAGEDKEIEQLNSTTLSAYPIGEQAVYNWYDESGALVYTGKDFTVSPDVTTKYKLEVIASIDGFKDYDEVEVKVKEYSINSISPNPSNNVINIDYRAQKANSAYIMVVPLFSGTSNQYILNTSATLKTIDVSTYKAGQYAVVLICDGNIVDYKNILVE